MNKQYLDTIDESQGFLLWKTTNHWQNQLKRHLAKIDLTTMEVVLLATLYSLIVNQGEAMQEHIARGANVGKMTVSKTLRGLEKKHLIHRREHEVDTRAKSITITNMGMHHLKQALDIMAQVDAYFFAAVGNENKQLRELLARLN